MKCSGSGEPATNDSPSAARPRAWCHICGANTAINADGLLRKHVPANGGDA